MLYSKMIFRVEINATGTKTQKIPSGGEKATEVT